MAATLRPSGGVRWAHCPISPALEALYPEDEDSPKAREGTAAHFYVTEAVQGRFHHVGTLAPNGHPIDVEMVECGKSYIEDVASEAEITAASSPHVTLKTEQFLTMHGLIHERCEGTPDNYLVDLPGKTIIVWDYKYGHGFVEPYRNEQMVCYVAGVMEAYELTPEDVADVTVIIRVVQPRNYDRQGPIREWRTTGPAILREIDRLAEAARATDDPNAPAVTGPHCLHCKARHACPALQAVGMLALDLSLQGVPAELSDDALGLELKLIAAAQARLKARGDGLAEVAMAKMRRGARVPHWQIGHTKPHERWTQVAADVIAMGDLMGYDLRKPAEAITPVQARKLGLDATVIASYSERPPGAAKLVALDDATAPLAFGD